MKKEHSFIAIAVVVVVAVVGLIFFNNGAQYSPKVLDEINVISDSDVADLISNGVMLSGSEPGNWKFADDVKIEIIDDSTGKFTYSVIEDNGKGGEVLHIRNGLVTCDSCAGGMYKGAWDCSPRILDDGSAIACSGCCDVEVQGNIYDSIAADCSCTPPLDGGCTVNSNGHIFQCGGDPCCKFYILSEEEEEM
jgi:hypothetical protein